MSRDDCDESDMVDFGRPLLVYVSVRAPACAPTAADAGETPNSDSLSEFAPSDCGGLLSTLAADSEFLRGRCCTMRPEWWWCPLAAIFSATSSATVFACCPPPSASSASDVAEVMLESRFLPHSSQPSPVPAEEDRSTSKLPLSLLPVAASIALIAGLAGELGRVELAYSLPGGGELGGGIPCARAYASGPHHEPLARFEFSLPERYRSADAVSAPEAG